MFDSVSHEDRTAALAEIDRVDDLSTHHRTPCGDGAMLWREWGDGPCIALLHGGFGSWLHWIRNVEVLAARYRVLACDIPGLGDSDEAAAPAGPAEIGAAVSAGLESLLTLGATVHLVGFSFGGLISGEVARRLGSRVRGLTLVGASGLGLVREPIQMRRRTPEMSEAERAEALRHNLQALMLHDAASVDALALEVQALNDARARVRSRRHSLGDGLRQALPEIGARLSGIWGELDVTALPRLDERRALLTSLHPETDFRVVPNAGHWVAYEAPEAFNAAALELLDAAG